MEELLESGASLYRAGSELGPAVEALIEENPTSEPGPDTLSLGQGTWEVIMFSIFVISRLQCMHNGVAWHNGVAVPMQRWSDILTERNALYTCAR